MIVELLVFVPSLFLVQFFRRIRSRPSSQNQISPLRQALSQIKHKSSQKNNVPSEKKQKKQSKVSFPWWCLFLAYGLSLVLVAVSIFFLIARGIEFGDLKTQKWLTSLICGFFSSILLIQPIKVMDLLSHLFSNLSRSKILSMAMFFACFVRKSDKDEEAAEYLDDQVVFDLHDDEEYLSAIKVCVHFVQLSENDVHCYRIDRLSLVEMRHVSIVVKRVNWLSCVIND